MQDDPDPPRKFYQLKPKDFDRVNPAAPRDASPSDPNAIDPGPGGGADPNAGRIDVRDITRIANANVPLLSANSPANRPTDVHAMLDENLAHANAAGLNDVTLPPKRRSRRTRDYFLVLIPVNAFLAFWAFGPYANPVTFVYGLGGMAFFTAALTWVMFGVMEKY